MQTVYSQNFWQDEQGGGTVMGLMWFMLLVGICGMAVDSTDGFRSQTMLQATADSSALAAAIDIQNPAAAVATAVSYATDNMEYETYGAVLDPADVQVGLWNPITRTLDVGATDPDAVMVTTSRSSDGGNALQTNFLRIIGWESWNISAQAVAQRYIPECLRNGLIARGYVDVSSNNAFLNNICIHGQQGVHMQNGNYHELGVTVSMPPNAPLVVPHDPYGSSNSNIGLPDALRENFLDPRMVNHVDEIMLSMLDMTSPNLPDYIHTANNETVIEVDEKFNLSNALPHKVYHVQCASNKNVQIPSNSVVHHVVIIAECEIKIGAGSFVHNAVLGSRSGGNPGQGQGGGINSANIGIAANVDLGTPDNCGPNGGVQMFSNATIHSAASTSFNGVQIVAAGDVELGARDQGINGISVQAGGNITMTSNNMFGLCGDGVPDMFTVNYYRLVM